jgi:hypothetical protein
MAWQSRSAEARVPVDRARTGRWIVVDRYGREPTADPLSGERFTEATANQEAAASRLAGDNARAIYRQAIRWPGAATASAIPAIAESGCPVN